MKLRRCRSGVAKMARDALAALACAAMTLACAASAGQEALESDLAATISGEPEGTVAWRLSGGDGRRRAPSILEVTGAGDDSNYWRSGACRFSPGGLYRFQMRARQAAGAGGCAIAGPQFANHDYYSLTGQWEWFEHIFRAPDRTAGAYLRLGQWKAAGTLQFDAVRVAPVLPVYKAVDAIVLGQAESIRSARYAFHGTFSGPGGNHHRTLWSSTAGFNTDRWCFAQGDQVTYRFATPGCRLLSGRVVFHVNYRTRGVAVAQVSCDGKAWRPLATRDSLGASESAIPKDLLPADELYVRLATNDAPATFQINRIEFEADLDGRPPDIIGRTSYVGIAQDDARIAVRDIVWTQDALDGRPALRASVLNRSDQGLAIQGATTVEQEDRGERRGPVTPAAAIPAGAAASIDLVLPALFPGENVVRLAFTQPDSKQAIAHGSLRTTQPELYRADYGGRLSGGGEGVELWWCDAPHKVARQRPAPRGPTDDAARLQAARNDCEAVQIVVRPRRPLKGLTARMSALRSVTGRPAQIAADRIEVLRVYYHFVDHPTDSTGVRDWWPDALPPLAEPIDAPAGLNQPLWLLVHVPASAAPGDYEGRLRLSAEGFSAAVPIRLHVWDFALPERNHIETAFGLSTGNIFRYHNLKTEEDRRKVLDLYFRSFADHRISPYDPAPLDPIRVRFLPEADPPRAQVDFSNFDRAMTRAVERYHFTGYRLPVQGMGGGTFHARREPQIEGVSEETPQYQAMFSDYARKLEAHFREKGWLEIPYVYWFDEPAPKDYEFVAKGMRRLQKAAPGLRRMITEEPSGQFDAPIDIWCPVSHRYNHEEADRRRALGERFWWYVCTGPKAPYCTLFIDHAATELRVWFWQAWQRNVVGSLVWQSNYWTSSAAFPDPDRPQNPYDDPMGYRSGYSTPRGVKSYWGNGDGRFLYPPLSAASPQQTDGRPVLAPPVSSIRWEMLREGIEDYEMLVLLRELVRNNAARLSTSEKSRYESLLKTPKSITSEMTVFTTDPAPILARRRQIAEAIEELNGGRPRTVPAGE